ncbi:MAG: restriction endonuclease subunit S [Gammaproteobacteria bacterium]
MSGWRECKLGDFADIQTGPFGSQLHASDYVDNGIPSIMPTNIGSRLEIRTNGIAFIKEADAKRLEKYLVKENDIVYSRRGDVEKCAFIKNKQSGWLCGTGCLRVRFQSSEIEPKFCAYYLSTEEIKGWVSGNAVGTTMPNLNSSILKRLPITLPSIAEQKAIAAVLSSLDDKIDLLHRQNLTLEAMAETLFRQWFIEEAKEVWEDGVLGDALNLVYGKALKDDARTGSGFPVVGSSGIVGYHADYLVDGPGIVIGRKGTLGKVIYLFQNFYPIDTTFYIQSKTSSNGLFYEYFLLKTLSFENSDSAVPGLNRDIALSEEIKLAPLEKIDAFNEYCSPLFGKLEKNISQRKTLEKLRDTLLPKLMSGEVRVML